jgi:hypothetical protein
MVPADEYRSIVFKRRKLGGWWNWKTKPIALFLNAASFLLS